MWQSKSAHMDEASQPSLDDSCDFLSNEADSSVTLTTETSSDHSVSSQQIVQKKNTTSQVWCYFGFVPESNGRQKNCDTPKCKLCLIRATAKWGNTSNLLNHLQKQLL